MGGSPVTQFITEESCPSCGDKISAVFLRDDPDDYNSTGVWVFECELGCTRRVRE